MQVYMCKCILFMLAAVICALTANVAASGGASGISGIYTRLGWPKTFFWTQYYNKSHM